MAFLKTSYTRRFRRHHRVRSRISGTAERPRLAVFRSARHITVQLIDDRAQHTLLQASDRDVQTKSASKDGAAGRIGVAEAVGAIIAERAQGAGITAVVFDRGGFAYHGRVKALAESARKAGLKF